MSVESRTAIVAALILCCTQAGASVNFEPVQTVYTPAGDPLLFEVATGDLDGDGDLDLVTNEQAFDGGAGNMLSTFRVLRNDGGLVFTPGWSLLDSGHAWEIALLLVDGDADPDLVAVVETGSGMELVVFPGDGAGGFGAPVRNALPEAAHSMRPRDLDADGDVDLAWPSTREVVGPGGTTFVRTLVTWLDQGAGFAAGQTVDLPAGTWFFGFAHWDDDAYPDALLQSFTGATLQVLRNSATGFVTPAESAAALPAELRVVVDLDVDGSGVSELVTLADDVETEVGREDANCALRIHARGGDGLLATATAGATRPVPCGSVKNFVAQDLDVDGETELLYTLTEGYDFNALNHFGLGGAAAPTQRPRFVVSGLRAAPDLDGDGRPDLLAVDGDVVAVARGSAVPNRLPVAPTLTFTGDANRMVAGSFATVDPDSNPIFYEVIDLPDGPFVAFGYSINDGTFDFEWSTGGYSAKTFTVRVSDRSGTPVDYVVQLQPGSGGGGGGGALDLFGSLALLGLALRRRALRPVP